VLAKIESADAVEVLDSILDAVDGAMVARGDLGAELPVECVPFWQSAIIQARPPPHAGYSVACLCPDGNCSTALSTC
jgi:pyruvate kinase